MIGFLHHLRHTAPERKVLVLHADRSPARHAHRAELAALVAELPAATLHRWYEDIGARHESASLKTGLINLDPIDLPADADAYLCGPVPFMTLVQRSLMARGITPDRIHYEVFGPAKELEAA
jgi:nitric oxide dioxygenase